MNTINDLFLIMALFGAAQFVNVLLEGNTWFGQSHYNVIQWSRLILVGVGTALALFHTFV